MIYQFCSNEIRRLLRQVDKVTVKGSQKPLGLYTIDMNLNGLSEKPVDPLVKKDPKLTNHKKKKKVLMTKLENDEMKSRRFIENDELLVKVLTQDDDDLYFAFREWFAKGMEEYFDGRWKSAKESFKKAYEMRIDAPIVTLLKYMEDLNFSKPDSWKGYRELTEK